MHDPECMPYIEIRAYPKDEEIKRRVAERIKDVFLEEWGCPEGAISVSFEEVRPEDWESKVVGPVMGPNADKMYISDGKKVR